MGRPTQHTPLSFLLWGRQAPGRGSKRPVSAMRYPNPTPAPRGGAGSGPASAAAAIAAGTRPDFPFPNPEAKTASADGTAPARVWESRTPPPTQTHRGPAPRAPPFLVSPHTTRTTGHSGHTRTTHGPQPRTHRHGHSHTTPTPRTHNTHRPHTVKATQPQPHSTTLRFPGTVPWKAF